jgi:glycosyltransferase involved in cell wall biosynthesis
VTIYLDVSAAVHRRAGLGRYATSLTAALAPRMPGELSLFYNAERGIEPVPEFEGLPARSVALGYKPWRMVVWTGHLAGTWFPGAADRAMGRLVPGAALFHGMEHMLLPLCRVPTVLTVHDLIFERLPGHHKPLNRWYLHLTLPLFCRRATHIIAVSEHTRADLAALYRIPPTKITVIPEAADPRFRPPSDEALDLARVSYGLPERYLLCVGTIEPRKNLDRLLAAWEPLYLSGEVPPLVIVGRRGWLYDHFFAALERSPARDGVIFPGWMLDDDLPAVYAAAELFLFPSIYEGFGLPVLEAMASGAPVVCSNATSLPEVAGDAVLFFDPYDVEAIRAALRTALSDAALRQDLRQRGFQRAMRFSWGRAAEETLALYRQLIQPTRP